MNEVWNLDPIYKGFDDPAFAADMAALKEMVTQYTAFAAGLEQMDAARGLREGILWEEKLTDLAMKLGTYSQLSQAVNTRDTRSASCFGQIMQILSATAGPQAIWKAWAAGQENLMELVAADEVLKEYTFLFEKVKRSSIHLLGEKGEEICAKLSISGGNAWSELHGYLTSTVPVEYDGGITNLSSIRNKAYDADPAVRKAAYEAEIACYDRIRDAVAFALNAIKMETISDCQLRGYESPLARTLEQSDMTQATLDAMFAAIDEYLPKFRQYLRAKGKALGHENGMPWYDLFAPVGRESAQYTTEQARDLLVELFSTFDAELAEMVQKAFDEAWIDFYPRDGKTGGAFCAGVGCIGQCRILTNYGGKFSDVVVLGHELGHAFHDQCVRPHRSLNKDYSMPVAETASTFNECVVNNAALARVTDKAEKLALLESQLRDATQIICDIYSRFRFEASVFANREKEFMNADALCALMVKAQDESYGDGLEPGSRHPYMWICKPHYYGPTFYNYPYAFGGLFARGLYAQYEKEGAAFVPKYKKLLYTTPVATVEDAAKVADIDLTDKDFWRSALQTIADKIDMFCQLAQELYGTGA